MNYQNDKEFSNYCKYLDVIIDGAIETVKEVRDAVSDKEVFCAKCFKLVTVKDEPIPGQLCFRCHIESKYPKKENK